MSTPVLVDCDPGVDDAIALLYALASPELDVRGVTTVAGNVSLAHANRNAARVLDLAGARDDLPLVPGLTGPVARPARIPDEPIHGEGGLGGLDLPETGRVPVSGHAPGWLAEQALAAPGELTLVALGPLSNVAAMLTLHPEAGPALREIVVMGGAAHCQGNITPAAEFNFFADPEAARLVLESGLPVRVVGLDVTRAALFPLERADRLAALPGAAGAAGTLLRGFVLRYRERFGVAAVPVHDALAVAAVTHPGLLDFESGAATVECAGEVSRGALVADLRRPERTRAVRVALGVDAEGFTRLLADRLAGYADPTATTDRP
ncbi:purine nucleosidase/pyrimidine-specific ribonucleoside hydrolase [Spinactinospora alkalitolerans]|uniref:Purine nucleosidase/pyrimidine-specific ribonucleoside hydrolase n=1 Tax=Spinactinospora alkalitolerans TaxID=687207 RepID=A0A852TRW5_9ACTN|nr:nucleoside hydrolase [Spinactinospora alkalitolerans]NYE46037.1 purine nucleosidase/pyrimidine-specific ribonucleoside hydrolase [Spinactinospora alkalitolerans]